MAAATTTFYYIGVDVGTGSARAALVDTDGNILSESTQATKTFRLEADSRIFEQSTADIWSCITHCVRDVVQQSRVDPSLVKGIGFDATCSLAVTDFDGNPISVTPEPQASWGPGDRNVILWADHRAEDEAKLINSTGSMVLNYVGKTMSVSSSFLTSSPVCSNLSLTLAPPTLARDGNPQGALAQEAHALRRVYQVHVL